MTGSRRNMPPYEVMSARLGSVGNDVASGPASAQDARADVGSSRSVGPAGEGGFFARFQGPVVVRLPRGYAAILGLGVLGVVLLAYWAGHHRGQAAMAAAQREDRVAENRIFERTLGSSPVRNGLNASGTTRTSRVDPLVLGNVQEVAAAPPRRTALDTSPRAVLVAKGRDPRKMGLNYMVLASDDQSGATRVLEFLWKNGIRAAAFRSKRHSLFKVVALDRGFTAQELRGADYREYRDRLVRLGQRWEASVSGARSFVKQGMHPDKFKGESHSAMIVRKDGR
jgi:hypothetical protein